MAETLVERIHALARKCAEQDALLKSLIAEVNVESLEKPYTAYKADPASIELNKLQDGALVITDSPATTNFRLPNVGEIVTSLTPLDDPALHLLDGARLSINGMYKEGLEKIVAAYDSTPLTANVHKVGNLVENNNVISGFSAVVEGGSVDSYAKLPLAFNPGNNPWEMVFKITTGNVVNTKQLIIATHTPVDSVAVWLGNTRFSFATSSDNREFLFITSGPHVVQPNTTYFIKLTFSGTEYSLSYSLDGTTYIVDISEVSSNVICSGSTIRLGIDYFDANNAPFLGSIDLSASYININNIRWWSGTKKGIFATETEWQTCVNQYGACGRFVYDSVAKTVRLPKLTGFTEGTNTASELGDLIAAGVPNLYGQFGIRWGASTPDPSGVFHPLGSYISSYKGVEDNVNTGFTGTRFEASLFDTTYGNSDTVQPQSIKVFYYIVLANTISTPVVADIQREVDSKVNAVEAAHAAMPSGEYVDLQLPAHGGSVYMPDDGYMIFVKTATVAGQFVALYNTATGLSVSSFVDTVVGQAARVFLPVSKNDQIFVGYTADGNTQYFRFIYANGNVPTNP